MTEYSDLDEDGDAIGQSNVANVILRVVPKVMPVPKIWLFGQQD